MNSALPDPKTTTELPSTPTANAIEAVVSRQKATERRQALIVIVNFVSPAEGQQAEDDSLRNRGEVSLALSEDGSAAANDDGESS